LLVQPARERDRGRAFRWDSWRSQRKLLPPKRPSPPLRAVGALSERRHPQDQWCCFASSRRFQGHPVTRSQGDSTCWLPIVLFFVVMFLCVAAVTQTHRNTAAIAPLGYCTKFLAPFAASERQPKGFCCRCVFKCWSCSTRDQDPLVLRLNSCTCAYVGRRLRGQFQTQPRTRQPAGSPMILTQRTASCVPAARQNLRPGERQARKLSELYRILSL
jgi:hypothetical protein